MPENEICPICSLPLIDHPDGVTEKDCRAVRKRIEEANKVREVQQ